MDLIQKIEKKQKNEREIAACEQKTTSEKANFCSNTVFSLYFKFRAKKFHAAKPLAFSLHFLFRRDQNHYSNLTSKITMRMCEQILKKDSAPNINQILWILKNKSTAIELFSAQSFAAIKNIIIQMVNNTSKHSITSQSRRDKHLWLKKVELKL